MYANIILTFKKKQNKYSKIYILHNTYIKFKSKYYRNTLHISLANYKMK